MASPQKEDGHIDIANEIVDKLCSYRISGQEWQILWVIIRKTWGWEKKIDWITLSQFQRLTGIDRRRCHSLLQKLCGKNIIKKSVTKKGDTLNVTYGIQKDFEKWRVSPKKVSPVTKKGDTLNVTYGIQKDFEKWRVSPKKVSPVTNIGDELSPKKTPTKDTITKDTIKDISLFNFWNDQKIIVHRKIADFISPMKIALKKYTEEEIKGAMKNLGIIINSSEYWWTHKYPLNKFLLSKGVIDQFLTVNNPLDSYKKNVTAKSKPKNSGYVSVEEKMEETRGAKIRGNT